MFNIYHQDGLNMGNRERIHHCGILFSVCSPIVAITQQSSSLAKLLTALVPVEVEGLEFLWCQMAQQIPDRMSHNVH